MATAGAHELTATLEEDAVLIDNRHYFACQLLDAVPVLVVDESPGTRDAFYLSKALDPGGITRTGWSPRVESVAVLRDAEAVDRYAAICLLDVGRLDDGALENLEAYVESGGGLAIFVGENTNRRFSNSQLYRNGEGLLPVKLGRPTQLLDRRGNDRPDVETTDHRLFRALAGERNSFLPLVAVDYYYAATDDWRPDPQTGVLARVRDGAPLVVERPYGEGRVVVHLTKISPAGTSLGRWSNWAVNPVFPVLASELMSYLAEGRQEVPSLQVGQPLAISVDAHEYGPDFRYFIPSGVGQSRSEMTITADAVDEQFTHSIESVPFSGIYEVRLPTAQGEFEVRKYGVNVNATEGDLTLIPHDEILRRLEGTAIQLHYADELHGAEQRIAGFQMSGLLLALIVGLLLAEQLLAYAASYHVPRGKTVSTLAGVRAT